MDLFEARIPVCLRKFIDKTLFDGCFNGPLFNGSFWSLLWLRNFRDETFCDGTFSEVYKLTSVWLKDYFVTLTRILAAGIWTARGNSAEVGRTVEEYNPDPGDCGWHSLPGWCGTNWSFLHSIHEWWANPFNMNTVILSGIEKMICLK